MCKFPKEKDKNERVSPYSSRNHKKPFPMTISEMDFFAGPYYTSSNIAGAGGHISTATLGPTGSYLNDRSDANPKLPSAICDARKRYPECCFKAGHLLNAQFGGAGNDPKNLTILSATGNANQKAFDEPVKRAVENLKKAYYIIWESGKDISNIEVGIEVKIEVKIAQPWKDETQIFKGLICTAKVTPWKYLDTELDKDVFLKFSNYMNDIEKLCNTATVNGEISNPEPE